MRQLVKKEHLELESARGLFNARDDRLSDLARVDYVNRLVSHPQHDSDVEPMLANSLLQELNQKGV